MGPWAFPQGSAAISSQRRQLEVRACGPAGGHARRGPLHGGHPAAAGPGAL